MNFKQGRHIVRAYYFIIIPYCYTMQDQEDSGQAIFRTPVRFATYNITLYGNVVIFSDSFFTIPILILVVVLWAERGLLFVYALFFAPPPQN